jgi:hypothetical protein
VDLVDGFRGRPRQVGPSLLTACFAHAKRSIPLHLSGNIRSICIGRDQAMTFPQILNLDSIVQRDLDVIAAEADHDLVMMSISNGAYYGVSNVAREIWEAIERPKKVSDLIDDLTATYNVDRSLCQEQTLSFLENLLSEHLVQVRDGPTS